MKNILDELESTICTVYFDSGNCYDGFVVIHNEQEVLMALVDDQGKYDGMALFFLSDIHFIEKGTRQLVRLDQLWKQKQQSIPEFLISGKESILNRLLVYIRDQQLRISIGLSDRIMCELYGTILGISEKSLELKTFSNGGFEDGIVQIPLNNIHVVVCSAKPERDYELTESEAQLKEFKSILLQSMERHQFLGLFNDPENLESFVAGFVIAMHEDEFLFARVTPTGEYDGYGIYCCEELLLLERDTRYLRKLELLYQKRNQHHELIEFRDDLMEDLLHFAYVSKKRVTLEVCESGRENIYGIIISYEKDFLSVRLIEDDCINGVAYVNINDITNALCDTVEDTWWNDYLDTNL